MKKYLFTFLLALIVGFFLSSFFINQYDNYSGIKVSGLGDDLYFVQYGVYSSLDSMEKETIGLENYVYNINEDMYYVYVGITNIDTNANKIVDYYKNLGYETIIKRYSVSNNKFIEELINYDNLLKETNDKTAIASLINQILIKYEEVVINGKD